MKKQIFLTLIAAALATGCASMKQKMGASAENDQDVLTGGPVIGTTVNDLPQPVRNTLQQQVPAAEISNISRENRNGRTLFKITFIEKDKYPPMYITDDGTIETLTR
jgi:hypothetical protein